MEVTNNKIWVLKERWREDLKKGAFLKLHLDGYMPLKHTKYQRAFTCVKKEHNKAPTSYDLENNSVFKYKT